MSQTSAPDNASGGITIPPLNGTIGHVRQKPSRVGLGERQYSYDITTGTQARIVPRSNPSPPAVHHRQYSEGAGVEKTSSAASGGRNASVSSLDTSQSPGTINGIDTITQPMSGGGRRRHGHGHSHAHSHHHHPSHTGSIPPKPASMMSKLYFYGVLVNC
jgi:hypothetical protein